MCALVCTSRRSVFIACLMSFALTIFCGWVTLIPGAARSFAFIPYQMTLNDSTTVALYYKKQTKTANKAKPKQSKKKKKGRIAIKRASPCFSCIQVSIVSSPKQTRKII